jgi:hypothetical protein
VKFARSTPLFVLAGLLIVVGLPLAGKWARRNEPPRCALDGLTIEPGYRVRVVDRDGKSRNFCCVRCAEQWLARRAETPAAVFVTDEAHGEEVSSDLAHFVRSRVTTNPITGNRTHAFQDHADAQRHVDAYGGQLLTGAARPFEFGTRPTAGRSP